MKTESADWYDTPLYYDIVFDADTSKEADFLEAVAIKHGASGFTSALRILEPACVNTNVTYCCGWCRLSKPHLWDERISGSKDLRCRDQSEGSVS